MPRPAIWLYSLAALAALISVAALVTAPRVQQTLEDRAQNVLTEQGLSDRVTVRADGRDLLVSSDDEALAQRAAELLRTVNGARSAQAVAPVSLGPLPDADLDGPFALRTLDAGGVALYGDVPSDIVRERLLAAARQAFPGVEVRDGLAVDSTAEAPWADDVAAALLRLRTVEEPGLAVAEDGALVASGRVETEATRLNTITRLSEIVDPREVRDALELTVPVAPPADESAEEPPDDPASPEAAQATPEETPEAEDPAPPLAPSGRIEVQVNDGLSGTEEFARALRQSLGSGSARFEPDSDRLTPGSAEAIRRAAEVLKANPDIVIELQGHADPSERGAFDLSAARARAAKRVLTEAGVPFEQIEAAAYSDSTPIARGSSEEARAQNRRVVFKLLRRR
ncbi:MAG: OmpA family protein [Bacteroidota bacterium]